MVRPNRARTMQFATSLQLVLLYFLLQLIGLDFIAGTPTISASSLPTSVITTSGAPATRGDRTRQDHDKRDLSVRSTSRNESQTGPHRAELLAHSNVRAQEPERVSYAVVVDCGSSGTRVQIFYWPSRLTEPQGGAPQLASLNRLAYQMDTLRDASTSQPMSLRIRPGLSSVRDEPEMASDYLRPIMRFASSHVPPARQPQTPVYVLGTAGMRSLTDGQQASILRDITRDLPREFAFRPIVAEVIPGVDEGFYQWLSMNTLARRLGSGYDEPPAGPQTRSTRSRRLGLVEMGGYSAQVAFEVGPQVEATLRRRLKFQPGAWRVFTLSGRELGTEFLQEPAGRLTKRATISTDQSRRQPMSVFAVSFLGFGSDIVRQWAVDLLVRDSLAYLRHYNMLTPLVQGPPNATQLALDDPCLPSDSHELMLKPAGILEARAKSLGHALTRPGEPSILVRLNGRGNFPACLALLNRMLMIARAERSNCQLNKPDNPDEVCPSALIGTNFVPWEQLQFIGLGEFYYTSHEMLRTSGRFNGPLVQFEAQLLCSKPLELINRQYPARDEFTRRRNQLACFKSAWMLAWLSTGLRMPLGHPAVNFTTTTRVDGQDVDWKLGAVLTRTIGASRAPIATLS